MAHLLDLVALGTVADLVHLDKNNRILLPQELRLYAGLEKQLCLIGQGKKLEIWNLEAWNSQREKWFTENMINDDLPEKLKTLVL